MILSFILAFVFGLIAAEMDRDGLALFAAICGFLVGMIIKLTGRVNLLEAKIKNQSQPSVAAPVATTPTEIPVISEPIVVPLPETITPIDTSPSQSVSVVQTSETQSISSEQEILPTPQQYPPDVFDKLAGHIKRFFTDGNVFAKVGLIILFFGIGFLVKYAAERQYFPIELRFILAAIIGLVLLIIGWRLRQHKATFALLLQGGGIGVMYLTIFAAAKIFTLVPLSLALVVMISLVVFSSILAILQDAKYLAMFAAAGGFLAPILTSTGGGSHILLFSYYALINIGIVSIAWYRSWREVNLLGFLFTFIIGLSWGIKYYQPDYLFSVEPFLILFFVLFLIIPILFATRQPPQLKGYVDATLVFGVPIVAFGLQARLVNEIEYGLAISALSCGIVYIILAVSLWRRHAEGLRLLTEAFLALGVIFTTLTIPLALSGRWTSAAWAIEGAGLIWVGVRQHRLAARLFGILLELAAGLAFITAFIPVLPMSHAPVQVIDNLPIIDSTFLGAILISLAGYISSYFLYKNRQQLHEFEEAAHLFLLVWAILWWLGAGLHELQEQLAHIKQLYYLPNGMLLYISITVLGLQYLEQRKSWTVLQYPILGFIGMLYFCLLILTAGRHTPLLDKVGLIAWPMAIVVQYRTLYLYRNTLNQMALKWLHVLTAWLTIYLITHDLAWLAHEWVQGKSWQLMMWLLIPSMIVVMIMQFHQRLRWPIGEYYSWYLQLVLSPVIALLWLMALGFALFAVGDPWPLDIYLPVVNPNDLAVCFTLVVILKWKMEVTAHPFLVSSANLSPLTIRAMAILAFALLNGTVARAVHFWWGVPFDLTSLLHSIEFHSVLSVLWTLTALAITVIASRQAQRRLWLVGSALLIAVVIKLFIFDLASSGTLARIVSFITVGIILLLVNYFSPIPPKPAEDRS